MSAKKATTLLEAQEDKLARVERGAECGFKELVGSLVASNDKTQAKTQASGEKILASDDAFLQAFKNVSEDLLAGIHGLKDATEKGVTAGAPTTRHVTQCEPAGQTCKTGSPAKVNAVVSGTVYQGVEGLYTCDFTNDKKVVVTTVAVARSAGDQGAAIITCLSPVLSQKYVTGKEFKTTVTVNFVGEAFKYVGKTGGNRVTFKTEGPTVTSLPAAVIGKVWETRGKMVFTFVVVDRDTDAANLKVAVKASNTKVMPDRAIKVSRKGNTFTVEAMPDINAATRDKVEAFAFNIDATDEFGNKMEKTAVLKAELKLTQFIMKLCTSDGNKRSWGNGWWGQSSPTNAASAANHASAHKDIKTTEYNTPIGTGIKITAWDCHNCKTKGDKRSSTKLAEAFYKVRSQYQKASLRSLLTGGNGANVNFAVRDNSVSAKDGSMRGKGGQPNGRPDLFMDKYDDLIGYRTNNFYGAHNNYARISTTYSPGGGHRLGGIGGTHYHGSWQADFEAAPFTPYCNPEIQYGTDGYHRHRSYYVWSSCGGFARRYVDYTIERYFP